MKEIYRGTYTDTDHPGTASCTIEFEPGGIRITTIHDPQMNMFWDVDKIWTDTTHNDTLCILRYRSEKSPVLKIYAKKAKSVLVKNYPKYDFAQKNGDHFITVSRVAYICSIAVVCCAAAYFFLLPLVANFAAEYVPQKIERQIGDQYLKAYTENRAVDTTTSALVQEFFDSLRWPKEYEYKIEVVRSDEINAFALPGGRMVVLDNLLAEMGSYKELAALLAHESSHVELKHSTKSLVRALSTSLLMTVALGDLNSLGGILVQNADVLNTLTYSRKVERQADMKGVEYLQQAGIDPHGMVSLLKVLKKHSSGIDEFEFINSHPALDKRIEYVGERLDKPSDLYFQSDTVALQRIWDKIRAQTGSVEPDTKVKIKHNSPTNTDADDHDKH